MTFDILSHDKDPMGAAIADYYNNKKTDSLRVFSSQFDEDEIPVSKLFRNYNYMSAIEKKALQMANGRILDVGAGSGCHSLALQEMNKAVTAIDISSYSVEVMKKRGVIDARELNIFNPIFVEKFDSIIMLMNGSGIVGKLENMPSFFLRMKQILNPGGKILMDSSDLKYLFEEEDGSYLIDIAAGYYGEIDYQMQYKNIKGEIFDWLYIDFNTLCFYASQCGFESKLIKEGSHYDYLAELTMKV